MKGPRLTGPFIIRYNSAMIYEHLEFPKPEGRPFFYSDFVMTVDGKVQVLKDTDDYWPIGSANDQQVLRELRAYADVLVHGRNSADMAGRRTVNGLRRTEFRQLRQALGKHPDLPYYVVTSRSENLPDIPATFVGPDLRALSQDLHQRGLQNILVEGGPTLLGSFLKENLLDEIFLTITPKIFGSQKDATLTLVEGVLFPPDEVKRLELISLKQIESELFLRYQVVREGGHSV